MNTYLIPVADSDGDAYIVSIKSRSLHDAEEKFIEKMVDTYDIDYPGDMRELSDSLTNEGVVFGEFYDLEEF